MSTEQNKEIARRFYAAFDANELDTIETEILSPDAVIHVAGMPDPLNVTEYKQLGATYRAAFPDMTTEIHDLIAEGDRVAVLMTNRGTQTGPFQNIPATGRAVTLPAIAVCRIKNGKIVEKWEKYDNLGMLVQLGVMPASTQG